MVGNRCSPLWGSQRRKNSCSSQTERAPIACHLIIGIDWVDDQIWIIVSCWESEVCLRLSVGAASTVDRTRSSQRDRCPAPRKWNCSQYFGSTLFNITMKSY